jgi:hypothetical protein
LTVAIYCSARGFLEIQDGEPASTVCAFVKRNDELLAEPLRKPRCEESCENVGRAGKRPRATPRTEVEFANLTVGAETGPEPSVDADNARKLAEGGPARPPTFRPRYDRGGVAQPSRGRM